MNTPFFSIIIPVYNTAQNYLTCCLDSLRGQTFSDFEVIIVDDGSKESCAEMLDRYAQTDGRIRVIHQENQGSSAARNNGIYAAKADWIWFVDADDWVEAHACQKIRGYLENCDCDILQFNAVKEYASRQEKMNYGLEHGKTYDASDLDTREFLYRKIMNVPGKFCAFYYSWDRVIRRSFLVDNALQYPVGVPKSEDKVFFLRCAEKLGKIFYVSDVFYHYRINSESAVNHYNLNADKNCTKLAQILKIIALRMDEELAEQMNQKGYDRISQDCNRFIFGILSDVLFQKYFHADNPMDSKTRNQEAISFLSREPFRTVIHDIPYGELSTEAKMKKFLLSKGMPSVFCWIKNKYSRILKKKAA